MAWLKGQDRLVGSRIRVIAYEITGGKIVDYCPLVVIGGRLGGRTSFGLRVIDNFLGRLSGVPLKKLEVSFYPVQTKVASRAPQGSYKMD